MIDKSLRFQFLSHQRFVSLQPLTDYFLLSRRINVKQRSDIFDIR
jgi:hypothetical protein